MEMGQPRLYDFSFNLSSVYTPNVLIRGATIYKIQGSVGYFGVTV